MSKRSSDHYDDSNRSQKQSKPSEWATLVRSPLSVLLKHKKELISVKETSTLQHVMEVCFIFNIIIS